MRSSVGQDDAHVCTVVADFTSFGALKGCSRLFASWKKRKTAENMRTGCSVAARGKAKPNAFRWMIRFRICDDVMGRLSMPLFRAMGRCPDYIRRCFPLGSGIWT